MGERCGHDGFRKCQIGFLRKMLYIQAQTPLERHEYTWIYRYTWIYSTKEDYETKFLYLSAFYIETGVRNIINFV